jgi:predicted DNA-binding ribbon-helix-helix protein
MRLHFSRLSRMQKASSTTTVRVSRRTHRVLSELAASRGRSVAELVDQLAEQARRQDILSQSAARMAEVLADPDERRQYMQELAVSEAAAAEVTKHEPPFKKRRGRA